MCPKVVMLKKHVLVMEFIGQDGRPAPKLTDVALSPEDLSLAYHQCVEVRRVLRTTSVSRCTCHLHVYPGPTSAGDKDYVQPLPSGAL